LIEIGKLVLFDIYNKNVIAASVIIISLGLSPDQYKNPGDDCQDCQDDAASLHVHHAEHTPED
jgi:hypothetical protein